MRPHKLLRCVGEKASISSCLAKPVTQSQIAKALLLTPRANAESESIAILTA